MSLAYNGKIWQVKEDEDVELFTFLHYLVFNNYTDDIEHPQYAYN